MKISIVTNMWPTAEQAWAGVFVQREVEALRRVPDVEVDVISVETTRALSRYVTQWPRVEIALRRFQPDLVHFHYGLSQLLSPWWAGPSVVTFHGSDLVVPRERRVSLALLELHRRRATIFVSGDLSRHVPDRMRRSRTESIVPCGVDARHFSPMDKADARRRLGMAAAGPVLMFPASPEREVKNYPLFCRTVDLVRRDLGTEVAVVSLDNVRPEEAALRYGAADVVVLTSHHEGSPLVVKEALACRRPVVSVPVGDVARYSGGSLPCAVCGDWDAHKLAALVCEAVSDREASFEGVEIPTAEAEAAAVRDLYRRLLESARSRRGHPGTA